VDGIDVPGQRPGFVGDDGLMEIGENLPGHLFDGFRAPGFVYFHIKNYSSGALYSNIL
jgi:hypothetical protein